MVAVVAAARDGRRRSRLGPGLHPRCGPWTCWVRIHGWWIHGVEHGHSPALIPMDARGPSTTLIHHLVVKRAARKTGVFCLCCGSVLILNRLKPKDSSVGESVQVPSLMPRLATHVHTSSTTIVVSQGAESPIDPSVAWGYPCLVGVWFRTSGSTGTEMSGRDLNSKRPLHRRIDFTASELESYQKGCRKQQGWMPVKSRSFLQRFGRSA
jgi:hypothetical protein